MKRSASTLLPALALFFCTSVFAQSDGETHGGGTGIPASDFILLTELSNRGTCDIKVTDTFLSEYHLQEEVDTILKALAKTHAYMAYRIRKEMHRIQWCLTATRLVDVQSTDTDSLLISYDPKLQVAIRDIVSNPPRVYLDTEYFNRMKPNQLILGKHPHFKYNQAMLVIHETLHTFLDRHLKQRNNKLRSLTRAIYANYTEEKSPLDLDAAIAYAEAGTEFETVAFAQAFDQFMKSHDPRTIEQASNTLAKTGTNPALYFDLIVNDLGRADLLAQPAFGGTWFQKQDPKDRLPDLVPAKYHYDALLGYFLDQEPDTYNHKIAEKKTPLAQIAIFKQPAVTFLGGCKVRKKMLVDLHANHDMQIFSWQYDLYDLSYTFTPDRGTSTRHVEVALKEALRKINYALAARTNAAAANSPEVSHYQQAISALFTQLKEGFCNSSQASGLPFYNQNQN